MKLKLFLCSLLIVSISFGNNLNKIEILVYLAKTYKKFSVSTDITEHEISKIEKYNGTEFEFVAHFIKTICTSSNNIWKTKYMQKPDSISLKYFHIVVWINHNLYSPKPKDNLKLAKKYLNRDLNIMESLRIYYSSLLGSIVNKNKGYNLSEENFLLDQLNLTNEREQAIFFLEFINMIGKQVIIYHRYMKEPKFDKIIEAANKLPKFNDLYYYQYSDLNFNDFNVKMGKKKVSYKNYFINAYYQTLIAHYLALNKTGANKEEISGFLSKSILRERQFYQYSKDQAFLNKLFKKMKIKKIKD